MLHFVSTPYYGPHPAQLQRSPARENICPALRFRLSGSISSEVVMTKGSGSRVALLSFFCALFLVGGIEAHALRGPVIPPGAAQSQTQNAPEVRTFTGKVLSQNGERFILRDEANETWYHLDDQQLANFAARMCW